jgi:hypothetical protein
MHRWALPIHPMAASLSEKSSKVRETISWEKCCSQTFGGRVRRGNVAVYGLHPSQFLQRIGEANLPMYHVCFLMLGINKINSNSMEEQYIDLATGSFPFSRNLRIEKENSSGNKTNRGVNPLLIPPYVYRYAVHDIECQPEPYVKEA